MNFLSVEQMNTLDVHELLAYLEAIRDRTADFKVKKNDIDESMFSQERMVVDDLSVYFNGYENAGLEFPFPYGDTRRAEIHNYCFLGRKAIPWRGFHWSIRPVVKYKQHGVVEVTLMIEKLTFNRNNKKYDTASLEDIEVKEYYFDYEEQLYKEVVDSQKNKFKERKEELAKRKLLNRALNYQIEVIHSEYVKELDKAAKYFNSIKQSTLSRVEEFRDFFEQAKGILAQIKKYFKIKYVCAHVDRDNYDYLMDYINKSIEKVSVAHQEIQMLNGDVNIREDTNVSLNIYLHDVVSHIKNLFAERSLKTSDKSCGFIKITSERVYYNLTHIEVMRLNAVEDGALQEWYDMESVIINEFIENKENLLDSEVDDYFIDETKNFSDKVVLSFLEEEDPRKSYFEFAFRELKNDKQNRKAFMAYFDKVFPSDESFDTYIQKKLQEKREILRKD
ncbi:hypothetical protein [Halobacillus faecis]|uniref:Uncharacterized protein n=1 Tax=Halobacillus faecis TaxID=360184 RepID=A0A511WWM3_9BACI|nr:hypothetical protein [Halobacillus faecis]GEN55514.1 hypothetical protein HFA01_37760 [Halobacillus faecis]